MPPAPRLALCRFQAVPETATRSGPYPAVIWGCEDAVSTATKIEWTEATWNPVRGCTKISPGCKHCYASVFAERFRGVPGHAYGQGFDLPWCPRSLRNRCAGARREPFS